MTITTPSFRRALLVLGVLLPLLAEAEAMSRAEADKIFRPLIIQTCTKRAETDPGMQSGGAGKVDYTDYCGCTYDELTRGMSTQQVIEMFLFVGKNGKDGKIPEPYATRMANGAVSCMSRQVRSGDTSMRAVFARHCVAGFSRKGDDALLPPGQTPEKICDCMVNKLLVEGSAEDQQLLSRAASGELGAEGLNQQDETRIAMMALTCMAEDSK